MDERGESPQENRKGETKTPLVIGVGASASATNSVERFFSKLSLDPDQAIVVVLQHREALDENWLRGIIERLDGTTFSEARDGAEIEGGTIYLCAADAITTIQADRFAVRPAQQAPGERATIDSFLVSVAEERAEDAIGVVLAGTGGDGTLGVATLKDHGGLALSEKTGNDGSDHLADSSTPAAIADFVLAPEDIPEHIQVYARHLRRLEEKQGFDEVLAAAAT